MSGGIRLYFTCFSSNDYISEQRKHRLAGIKMKNRLKTECMAQLTGNISVQREFPMIIDFTFISTHKYDIDNYSSMAKYIQDCLVFRGILQDDNSNVINEVRIRAMTITAKAREGCYIQFFPNLNPEYPKLHSI